MCNFLSFHGTVIIICFKYPCQYFFPKQCHYLVFLRIKKGEILIYMYTVIFVLVKHSPRGPGGSNVKHSPLMPLKTVWVHHFIIVTLTLHSHTSLYIFFLQHVDTLCRIIFLHSCTREGEVSYTVILNHNI